MNVSTIFWRPMLAGLPPLVIIATILFASPTLSDNELHCAPDRTTNLDLTDHKNNLISLYNMLSTFRNDYLSDETENSWYRAASDICQQIEPSNCDQTTVSEKIVSSAINRLRPIRDSQCRAIDLTRKIQQTNEVFYRVENRTCGLMRLQRAIDETVFETEQILTTIVHKIPGYMLPLEAKIAILTGNPHIFICKSCDYRDEILGSARNVIDCILRSLNGINSGNPFICDDHGCEMEIQYYDSHSPLLSDLRQDEIRQLSECPRSFVGKFDFEARRLSWNVRIARRKLN